MHRLALSALVVLGAALGDTSRAGEQLRAKDVTARRPLRLVDTAQVIDADKPLETQKAILRMREILARITQNLEEAREERDVVKLNCVNEKLSAVKGLLKISELSQVTLADSLSRRRTEIAAHEFEKVSIAMRKSEQLLIESEACVGELAVYSGDTDIEVVRDGVSDDDPTKNANGAFEMDDFRTDVATGGPQNDFDRPPPASPFR
jgi:hypothetical protein